MKAVRIHSRGGPEVLQVEEIPEPEPGPHDLLVRLRATSVNHRDIWMRKGHPHPAYQVDLPAILGIDVCGEVVEAGSEVDGFAPGDRVTANPYMFAKQIRILGSRLGTMTDTIDAAKHLSACRSSTASSRSRSSARPTA